MSKFEDLRLKSDDQLSADLAELKREQFNLRFQAATSQLERPARIQEVRRQVARIKTWIFKGEILGHDPLAQDRLMLEAQTSGVRPSR